MYYSVWKLSLCNLSQLSAPGSQISSNDTTLWITVELTLFVCLRCNFQTNEDKIKILSSGYLMSLIDVTWDIINCQKEGFLNFCNAHIFFHTFKNLTISRLLEWLQWCLVASSKPRSHICDITFRFSLSIPIHSWWLCFDILAINFIMFLAQQTMKLIVKNVEA